MCDLIGEADPKCCIDLLVDQFVVTLGWKKKTEFPQKVKSKLRLGIL